jgi:regulator of sigma E protease
MTAAVQQIVIGVLVLGVLVLIHELGHFVVAKLCGIRVLSFSIGFGKPLFAKTVGGTEYRISAIPVGGYVHMAGEHPEDAQGAAPDEYTAKPIWQRALVALSGPSANYVSSTAILWLMFLLGAKHEMYLDRPVIGAVADSSAAREVGLFPGDSVVAVNGEPVGTWEDIEQHFSRQESRYTVTFIRNGGEQSLSMSVPSAKDFGVGGIPNGGMLPALPSRVGAVTPGSPAQQAGLLPGDVVVAIGGERMYSWYQLSQTVSLYDTAGGPLTVAVRRADSAFTVDIRPEYDTDAKRYLLGLSVGAPATRIVRFGPLAAFARATEKTWDYTTMIFDVVAKLLTKKVSPRQLAGPIGIVQMSGVAALGGLAAVLNFVALIGINLAVLNLFPLVITDGGAQLLINRIAISFFIALFLFVTFNDIRRIPLLFRLFSR